MLAQLEKCVLNKGKCNMGAKFQNWQNKRCWWLLGLFDLITGGQCWATHSYSYNKSADGAALICVTFTPTCKTWRGQGRYAYISSRASQNILCRWQRRSWSELTNVWKRKGNPDSKTTAYLFLCALCRRKKDINCPYLLISLRIVDGKVWQFLVFSATCTLKTCFIFNIRKSIHLCHIFILCYPMPPSHSHPVYSNAEQLG